jgi:hypothetical protein
MNTTATFTFNITEQPDGVSMGVFVEPPPSTQMVAIILENLATMMTYAFSLKALGAQYNDFAANTGQSTALMCAFFAVPRRRATRACFEFAAVFRALSEVATINARPGSYGNLYDLNGQSEPLELRQLTNKIIHAERIEWDFNNPDEPLIVCHASPQQQASFDWTRAEIPVKYLAEACSSLDDHRP